MAFVNFGIDKFKNYFGHPARPTLFVVSLAFPANSGITWKEKDSFMCKGAQLPSRSIGIIELSYMGRKAKFAGDSVFDAWTIQIYNDQGFYIKNKLETWAEVINGARNNISATQLDDYKATATVKQLSGTGETLKQYTMIGLVPTSTGDAIDMSWDNNDSAEEYSVTFEMDYWETSPITQ